MSADEVKALDNNGDPMGYVVPKAMRSLMDLENFRNRPPLFSLSRTWDEDVSTNTEENNAFRVQWLENVPLYRPLKVTVTVSDYEAGIIYFDAAFGGYNTQSNPIRENGTFVFTTTPNEFIYGMCWCKNEGSGCKCTVTVDSVEVVGLLAEYLPQNLMYGRDDKSIATSWLDSAKQLPLSDEYMEPLFQSIGGYDMTANGAPEILYNE